MRARDQLTPMYRNVDEWQPAYLGSYLNWGYWQDIEPPYTPDDRVRASAQLYRLVARSVDLRPEDAALEVGSGTGVGAKTLHTEYGVAELHGIDVVAAQIDAANAVGSAVTFVRASADEMPYEDERFDVVYSVEALQHFDNVPGFAREARRVLRPGGRLGVTTFFPAQTASAEELGELLQSYRSGFDVVTTVRDLTAALEHAGFVDVTASSIGEFVWRQLDDWITDNGYRNHWGRNFLRAHQRGLIDYHLLTARVPERP